MTGRRSTIAIDGPAGAGKSTVARRLATELGYEYVDSGALYRVVGLAARECGLDGTDAEAAAAMVASLEIEITEGADGQRVLLDGRDVTLAIRAPEAGEWASRLAAVPAVRAALIARQRAYAAHGGIVMEGRDIGTVVFPNAEHKFFVTASVEERAKRRQAEHPEEALEAIRDAIVARDRRDEGRAVAPLRAAPDAEVLDTSGLSLAEVVEVLALKVRKPPRP